MLISYAQNMEDVILWRALKHVAGGFYIDIGAHDPVVDSVSLAFYERGWRGIHVEPSAFGASRLREARLGEEVLQLAVGRSNSILDFFDIDGTGLSTGIAGVAEGHRAAGHAARKTSVPSIPLASILDRFQDRAIHWLKIDVEGMEEDVIRSWAPSRVRPWIVLIEAIEPCSQKPGFASWEPGLQALGYEYAYFDGINRFYVSRDRLELKAAFGPGPNVLDGFALSGRATSSFCVRLNEDLDTCRRDLLGVNRAAKDREIALRVQTEAFQGTVAAFNDSRAALTAALSDARCEIEAQRNQITAKLQVLSRVQLHVEALRQEREGLREERTGLQAEREVLQTKLSSAEAQVGDLRELSHRLWVAADAYKRELEANVARRGRLRRLGGRGLRGVRKVTRDVLHAARLVAGSAFDAGLRYVRRHPRVRILLGTLLGNWPALRDRLATLAARRCNAPHGFAAARHGAGGGGAQQGVSPAGMPGVANAVASLSASARLVHLRIQAARALSVSHMTGDATT